jgi:hypothetical protein
MPLRNASSAVSDAEPRSSMISNIAMPSSASRRPLDRCVVDGAAEPAQRPDVTPTCDEGFQRRDGLVVDAGKADADG